MTLVKWRPMRDIFNFQDEMSRVFDRFFDRSLVEDEENISFSKWYPQVDISENIDSFMVLAELPGLSKDEVHITFTDGLLKIEGERKREKEDKDTNFHRVERVYGKFCRTFQLPKQIKNDKVSADFKDGILKIDLPKADEVKPKEIEVKAS
jgi:HSP20 family protein